ncbi:hypothetical protein CSKR_105308 [Clonorchis sinensis]|uniref:Uncharacterized protein n=1 Tax=Clonorchis sinensis TaxID=79923 RepID=A0A3R7CR82_CLOSI|nr:hypothetical protein CSKR_105308 [Clonorchis sinensis]
MGKLPVLLAGWRIYERIMVRRRRATLIAGSKRLPHRLHPSYMLQDLQSDKPPSGHNCGLRINKELQLLDILSGRQKGQSRAGLEPPAMGKLPVLLAGWRIYERIMVRRRRATLIAGSKRLPHRLHPSYMLQDLQSDKPPSGHNCGLRINKELQLLDILSGRQKGQSSKTAQSF